MSLFPFLRKNKQDSLPSDSDEEGVFLSRAQEDSGSVRSRSKRSKDTKSGSQMDPVLPEKKRARRRLVGALALVLAMIIGLPMLLDSEPKPLADDIAIQIPSKDKQQGAVKSPPVAPVAGLDQNEVLIPSPAAAPAAASSSSAKPKESAGESVNAAIPAKSEPPLKKDDRQDSKAVAKTKTDSKSTAIQDAKAEQSPDNLPASKTATHSGEDKSAEASRAQAILNGMQDEGAEVAKPTAPRAAVQADSKPGRIIIQVAALATQEKVSELQGKLTEAGIKSYTQKVATQGGERIRVRIGPFASKEEADKVRARLQKMGMNGTLVPT